MTDTEALNLIEHYGWSINKISKGWNVFNENIDVIGLSIREAIINAMIAQRKWSVG